MSWETGGLSLLGFRAMILITQREALSPANLKLLPQKLSSPQWPFYQLIKECNGNLHAERTDVLGTWKDLINLEWTP